MHILTIIDTRSRLRVSLIRKNKNDYLSRVHSVNRSATALYLSCLFTSDFYSLQVYKKEGEFGLFGSYSCSSLT